MAAPVAAITSFRALYALPGESDPYAGNYAGVMANFEVPSVGPWDPAANHTMVLNVGENTINVYVGLFVDPANPCGSTRLLHSPRRFPAVMGRPTPYDGEAYAFLDDVVGNTIQSVHFRQDFFNPGRLMTVPPDLATTTAAWTADGATTVLAPIARGAPNRAIRVPRLMYVPACYVSLFMGRRLTPRQLILEVCAQIEADGLSGDCQALVDWCIYAGIKYDAADDNSPVHIDQDVVPPVADATFLNWSSTYLNIRLPELASRRYGSRRRRNHPHCQHHERRTSGTTGC
jgi:hypothetical protein